jgi:hypothetical protein
MRCSDIERECLETLLHVRASQEFLDLCAPIEDDHTHEFEKRRSYLLQSSKSMMFHFLVGHELGHYLNDNRTTITSALEVYEWVDKEVLKDRLPSWRISAARGMLRKAVRQLQEEAPMSAEQLRGFMKQGSGFVKSSRSSRTNCSSKVTTTSWWRQSAARFTGLRLSKRGFVRQKATDGLVAQTFQSALHH